MIAIIIAVIFVGLGVFVYLEYYYEEEVKEEEPEQVIIDKISPLTNQAIFLEIHRIRKKGIIEHMENAGSNIINMLPIRNERTIKILDGIRPAFGWDDKPTFSYFTIIDNFEWEGRSIYKDWDTGYINQEIFRNVEDEQANVDIEFSIIEKIEQGSFLRRTTIEKEMDSFKVTYDFRTGRWDGDDSFNDSDGYGHYNGSNYEIWFSLTQTSDDGDTIPWWIETNVLGTDPEYDDSYLDPDLDGIPTEWEWKWGYDPFESDNHTILDPDLDGLQNTEEYYMRDWLANPYHIEMYLEADYMDQTPKKLFKRDGWDGWKHEFYKESQQMIIERFNEHGISVHIDDGRMGKGGDILPFGRGGGAYQQETGVVSEFYHNNFDDDRKGIFRYIVIAYGGGWCHPQDENHYYDCICVPHNRQFNINQLSLALSDRTRRIGQAVQILHELGHSLGFLYTHCGGVDNTTNRYPDDDNYPWFDYVSAMNYDYFMMRYFDYSNGSNGEYDADDWGSLDFTFFQIPSDEMEGIGA